MIPEAIAEARARQHSKHMEQGEQGAFLIAFARAREEVRIGSDTDGNWLRMCQRRERAATVAGYLEGLASTRTFPRTHSVKES